MPYHIKLKKNGRTIRKLTGYGNMDDAVLEAQGLADSDLLTPRTKVEVHPDRAKPRRKSAKKNPSVRRYKGHTIRSKKQGPYRYVVEPYGHKFTTLAHAKRWVNGHIKRESPKVNPAPPTSRKNPGTRKRKAPLSKRVNLNAKRIDWSDATVREIRAIAKAAKKQGKTVLARKAESAAARRSKK